MAAPNPGTVPPARPTRPTRSPPPQAVQTITYSADQVRNMSMNDMQNCLTQENIDEETFNICLRDPRADSGISFPQVIMAQAAKGDAKKVATALSRVRELGKDIGIMMENACGQAVLTRNFNVVAHIVSTFHDDVAKFATHLAFQCARNGYNDHTNAQTIDLLLSCGLVNIDERNSDGTTLLHCAGTAKQPEVIGVLKSKNANPFARDRSGRTAWEVARPTLTLEDLNNFVIGASGATRCMVDFPLTRIPGRLFYVMDAYWTFHRGTLDLDAPLAGLFATWNSPRRLTDARRLRSIRDSTLVIDMGGNVDFQFTWYISNMCSLLGFTEREVTTIVQFHSRTFLEQSAAEPRLRFREPSYNAMIQHRSALLAATNTAAGSSGGGGHTQTSAGHGSGVALPLPATVQSGGGAGTAILTAPPASHNAATPGIVAPTANLSNNPSALATATALPVPNNPSATGTTTNTPSPTPAPLSNNPAGPGTAITATTTPSSNSASGNTTAVPTPPANGNPPTNPPPVVTPADPNIVSIVLPYFHSLSEDGLAFRRQYWSVNEDESEERKQDARTANEQQALANFHEPRTLDESYYNGLNYEQLSRRNKEQVVGKLSSCESGDKPLLMIPQLWLFMADNVLVSAVSRNIGGVERTSNRVEPAPPINIGGVDPIIHLRRELAHGNIPVPDRLSGLQLFALIMSETINFLARPRSAGLQEPVFYTFETAVATLYDGVQTYVQEYRMESIRVEQEKAFINQINDVLDELTMIKTIIDQQEVVWNKFFKDFEMVIQTWDANLVRIVTRPNEQIPEFRSRLEKIEKDAIRIQTVIEAQLGLKTNYAALKESHNSTNLSTAVIGFTIITVFFTPLAFFCSLFALPLDRFDREMSSDTFEANITGAGSATGTSELSGTSSSGFFTSNYIGTWMAVGEVVSLVVTIVLVWLSFVWLRWRERRAAAKESQVANPFARHTAQPTVAATARTTGTLDSRRQGRTSRISQMLNSLGSSDRPTSRSAEQVEQVKEKDEKSRLTGNVRSPSVV